MNALKILNATNAVWGSSLQSNQPVWATSDVIAKADKLNKEGQRGNLAKFNKPKNIRMFPDGGLDDPLFADRNVRRYGTDIYFLDAIDDETQLILQVMLKQAQAEFLGEHVQDILTQTLSDTITIHLNSPGGYAYCGLALYDFIKQMQVPVTCIVEGSCASAATLILLACEERHMLENSVFLMHQCSWGAWGENRYMQDEAENSRKLMSRLRHIYMEETEIGNEYEDPKQREAFIQSILEHDRYFSKEECQQLGILKCDCEGDTPLSEESIAKLNAFAQELFEAEQKAKGKDSSKKNTKEKKVEPAKKTTPAKKSTKGDKPSKASADKDPPAKKTTKKS